MDDMTPQDQISVAKCLAKIQASLSRALPFDQIEGLVQTEDCNFIVGEFFSSTAYRVGGPYRKLSQLWRMHIDRNVMHASPSASHSPHFIPPPYLCLVLHHPDLAFHNILFDSAD